MRALLLLDINPPALPNLLEELNEHQCTLLAYATQDTLSTKPLAPFLDETVLHTLLTVYGLTPRQRQLIVLDLYGHTRAEIATTCSLRPASIKKYWTRINAKLGVQSRQMLREWVMTQYATQAFTALPEPHTATQECGS